MTPLAELLRNEIRRHGPIGFHRFMDAALYHAELGYYRRPRDPFGKEGDFFTASQLQPVFGELMARSMRTLREAMGSPADFTVVELGPGRGEMQPAFSEFRYIPVEHGQEMPERVTGVVFSNEFFDALPVQVFVFRNGSPREQRVTFAGERFEWVDGDPPNEEVERYLSAYSGEPAEGLIVEVNLDALAWMEKIAAAIERGYLFTIDYGYTRRERIRFPQGTLMSYRRHTASEDVLSDPGERDITAHVLFTALEDHGRRHGLITEKLGTLAQALLAAGESDAFAGVLGDEKRRLQLKQLLFGLGESFRTLLQRKAATNEKGPDLSGPEVET